LNTNTKKKVKVSRMVRMHSAEMEDINEAGAVNTRLETELPASVLAPLTGNPLQNLPPRQQ
jgi:translation elongation factor EF-G